jgi:hypothetical protein
MKDSDSVDDKGKDVSNCIGGDVDAMAGNDAMAGLTLWQGKLCPRGRLWSGSLTDNRKSGNALVVLLLSYQFVEKGSTTGCSS